MKLYFLTRNPLKQTEARHYAEWREIGTKQNVQLCCVTEDVQEILHQDIEKIVRQKVVAAYAKIGCPCVVEHGGLFMDALPGLPGGLGRIVWDAVKDRMCGFLRDGDSRDATARSFVAFCDGRQVRVYQGETRGRIAECARGAREFGWDQIFEPEGDTRTYGEMGLDQKRVTSPIYRAWDAFIAAERARFKELTGD